MCGRFTLTTAMSRLQERFAFAAPEVSYTPSYNVAPGQPVLTIINQAGERRAGYLRWGLVPSWAREPGIGNRMINARLETVADKPSFRQALRLRRCLVLADGFYEWQHHGKTRSPMYIRLHNHQPFAFAGLWDTWRDPAGATLSTCTILTTAANTLLRPIHERMPVILHPHLEALWLESPGVEPQELLPQLQPYAAEAMETYAVSRMVNSPQHNSPACLTPVSAAEQ